MPLAGRWAQLSEQPAGTDRNPPRIPPITLASLRRATRTSPSPNHLITAGPYNIVQRALHGPHTPTASSEAHAPSARDPGHHLAACACRAGNEREDFLKPSHFVPRLPGRDPTGNHRPIRTIILHIPGLRSAELPIARPERRAATRREWAGSFRPENTGLLNKAVK